MVLYVRLVTYNMCIVNITYRPYVIVVFTPYFCGYCEL